MNLLGRLLCYGLMSVWLCASALDSFAFAPIKHRWKGNKIAFHIEKLDESRWRSGFIEAVKRWEDTPIDIDIQTIIAATQISCRSNGRNEAWWAETNCGNPWGSRTLAVTSRYFRGNDEMKEADIVYNSNRSWDIYDGDRHSTSDFVRVTVHELGHALGADHSDNRNAIMYPAISNRFLPTIDDLYALSNGQGYGWEAHNKLKLKVSGDGYIRVQPKVAGTVGVSRDFTERFTDFSAFDCHGNCSHWVQAGLRLRLIAVATNGGSFMGWEGDSLCDSGQRCNLTPIHSKITVSAIFSGAEKVAPITDGPATAAGESIPTAPALMQVEHDRHTKKIRVEWKEVAGASMYKVLRADSASAPFLLIRKTAKNAIVDSALVSGGIYHYRVKACNEHGCSKPGSEAPEGA